jgi:hypothetical protein
MKNQKVFEPLQNLGFFMSLKIKHNGVGVGVACMNPMKNPYRFFRNPKQLLRILTV